MSVIQHKYISEQIPEPELETTFSARNDTLDYIVDAIRQQSRRKTLVSFLITGARGSGKTTLVRMVRLRIKQDPELNAVWLPVVFPEEQFNVGSLRDLLAFALHVLAQDGIEQAAPWVSRVEEEQDEGQSQEMAISGLKDVCEQQGKRLILFVESLDQLFDSALTDGTKATLRRLLMSEPFMFLVGSAVHVFDSLRRYDEAFFNYFCPVRLGRLDDEQVFDLLCRRARLEGNDEFLQALPKYKARVRAIVQLSGGNPRLVLMFYELLSQRKFFTTIQQLRRLVDELTPLLKDELQNLAPQQRKIIHALMEKGGTAQPTDLTGPTRLSLNTVTTQLSRLREMQVLELRGGGKGRAAHYSSPDQLFAIWYQMRYLRQHKRRIELFVDVLRLWFEAEERYEAIRSMCHISAEGGSLPGHETALTVEYFAESLSGTQYEESAKELALRRWLQCGDMREAALAYAAFEHLPSKGEQAYESQAYSAFGEWMLDKGDVGIALSALEEAVKHNPTPSVVMTYGTALAKEGHYSDAEIQFDRVIKMSLEDKALQTEALLNRGDARREQGNWAGAIVDFTAVARLSAAPVEQVGKALHNRGVAKEEQGDLVGAIADYTTVVELPGAPVDVVVWALFNRGYAKKRQDDLVGAIADYTAVVELSGASIGHVARALINRGVARKKQRDLAGAIADYTAVVELPGASIGDVAQALINRGVAKTEQHDLVGTVADYTAVVELPGASGERVASALVNRAFAKIEQRDLVGGEEDLESVLEIHGAQEETLGATTSALFGHRWLSGKHDEALSAIAIFSNATSRTPSNRRANLFIKMLQSLALPMLKEAWPHLLTAIMKDQPPEILEALHFFVPVRKVIEGAGQDVLDALPPEQREFAQRVIAKFESQK